MPYAVFFSFVVGTLGLLGFDGNKSAHAKSVYRCPGPPTLYTDNLTADDARRLRCVALNHIPPTVAQPRKLLETPPSKNTQNETPTGLPPIASSTSNTAIQTSQQKARDKDAKRILQEELEREESRLSELQREFNQGPPERQAHERNYQRYLERVEVMRENIARKTADVEAIRRELAKLPKTD
jgi:hypothetical protein